MDGRTVDTLFLAVTRPSMIPYLNVPLEAFVFTLCISFYAGLILNNPLYWSIALPIHTVIRALCAHDHNFISIHKVWAMTGLSATSDGENGGSLLVALPSKPPRHAQELFGCV
jgi:type IV secretory pathway VirB3-like protein